MVVQIGPFVVRVRNLRSELEAGLRSQYRFIFPHDRFAGLELNGRLAAVASDYFHVAPKRVMLLSGRIEGEGPRIQFAVLTGNPSGITSSKLAFLVLAGYEGQTNVVVKVEDIVESGITSPEIGTRKPPTKAPAAVPPEPERSPEQVRIEPRSKTSSVQDATTFIHRLVMRHGSCYLRAKPFEEAHPDLVAQYAGKQLPETELLAALDRHYGWPQEK